MFAQNNPRNRADKNSPIVSKLKNNIFWYLLLPRTLEGKEERKWKAIPYKSSRTCRILGCPTYPACALKYLFQRTWIVMVTNSSVSNFRFHPKLRIQCSVVFITLSNVKTARLQKL